MNPLAKLFMGLIGHSRPRPLTGPASTTITTLQPNRHGGASLMEALLARRSERCFSSDPRTGQQESVTPQITLATAAVPRASRRSR